MSWCPSIEAKVAETVPPAHSGEENTWNETRLEKGVLLQVPLFIARGKPSALIPLFSNKEVGEVTRESASCEFSRQPN
jgi:hypothetical protein